MTSSFSHFDERGVSRMVDVGAKQPTRRTARAVAWVRLQPETVRMIRDRKLAKGDVLEVARLAGIMAAKRVGELIPLCHPLGLDAAAVDFSFSDERTIRIETRAAITARTGVEMEALTAAAVAALTIYDMCKSVDRGMRIERIQLLEKEGGRSGRFVQQERPPDDEVSDPAAGGPPAEDP